jgi:uncharacterized membrane-anchored protein YhcB (DUF1043 family)
MFGEISMGSWLLASVVFAVGGAAGYIIARQLKDQHTRKVEEELDKARAELSDYRSQVDRHFLKTSLLFSKMTDNYREVYEHLATGAQALCGEKATLSRLDLPENKILPEAAAETADTTEAAEPTTATAPADTPADTTAEAEAAPAAEPAAPEAKATPAPAAETKAADNPADEDSDEVHLGVESATAFDTGQPPKGSPLH